MKTNHGEERKYWSRRPHFTPRQKLTADQLNTGLLDEIERQQIINRAMYGFGVVTGYGLTVLRDRTLDLRHGCLEISDGLALDRYGRMLVWKRGWIGMKDLVGPRPKEAGKYTLIAHYAVRSPETDDCSADQSQWTKESVVFSLRPGCMERECECPEHPSDTCVSHGEYVNRRNGGMPGEFPSVAPSPDVDWFPRKPDPPHALCDGGWAYDPDPRVGVPLACLTICDLTGERSDAQDDASEDEAADSEDAAADCEPRWGFCRGSKPNSIRVRPIVYRNPLLYELTRCCDVELPRIEDISWQAWIDRGWEYQVPWDDFATVMADPSKGFSVGFTKPIDPDTLHEASFFITVFYQDDDGSWRNYRAPVDRLIPVERDGKVRLAQLIPDQGEWLGAEITGKRSHLFDGCRVEVTLRGQLIRDECDRMLDARSIGRKCDSACEARPGDDFVTVFQVAARGGDRQTPYSTREDNSVARQVVEEERK